MWVLFDVSIMLGTGFSDMESFSSDVLTKKTPVGGVAVLSPSWVREAPKVTQALGDRYCLAGTTSIIGTVAVLLKMPIIAWNVPYGLLRELFVCLCVRILLVQSRAA